MSALLIDPALGLFEVPTGGHGLSQFPTDVHYRGVCHYFNAGTCHHAHTCYYAHLCSACGLPGHGLSVCPHATTLFAPTARIKFTLGVGSPIRCKADLLRELVAHGTPALDASMSPMAARAYAYFASMHNADAAARAMLSGGLGVTTGVRV